MTVSSTTSRVIYSGNGVTTSWPFNFKVPTAADLVVVYTDVEGVDTTLSYGSQYSATGFGQDAGGTVTYPLSGSPIATGTKLTIYRNVAVTQPTSISNQGAMWPAIIEAALDRLTFIAQKIADTVSRAITISPTDSTALNPLPNATQRANSLLGFDASGQPYAAQVGAGLAAASTWLITNFFPAASAAAARTAIAALAAADNIAFAGDNTHAGTEAFNGAATFNAASTFNELVTLAKALNGAKGTDLASASTTDIGAATGNYVVVTGTTTITALGTIGAGAWRIVEFAGALTLTHNATSLILPNGTNITTAAGDIALFVSKGSGNWKCVNYQKATGGPPVSMSPITASLGSDVALNNTGTYFDGPSVAQGTSGTWFVSGTVTLIDAGAVAIFRCKLWDGTTVIASGLGTNDSGLNAVSVSLSGFITSPAGNLRISCRDITGTNGQILADESGNGKDSTITAVRIA